ncbi:MAG TPA: HGxxPAAW family protein [Aeromicrobium sp.]|jgi:hypothetical protein|nr:HGxxPAAW family protein [Aeromicrobium sp.]
MHGSSPAAWTAVLVALVGITVGGIALIPTPNWVLFWIGVVISLGSLVVGRVMSAAGMGASDSH